MKLYFRSPIISILLLISCYGSSPSTLDMSNFSMQALTREETFYVHSMLPEIRGIDISNNNIEYINSTIFETGSKMCVLIFDNNSPLQFNQTGEFLWHDNLRRLSLAGCNVTKIYEHTFSKLPLLNYIDLSNNFLTSITDEIFAENRDLQIIVLSVNDLKNINSTAFIVNDKLCELTMNQNYDYDFPVNQTFLESKSLKIFKCENCGIRIIYNKTFVHLPRITELHLNRNKLSHVEYGAFFTCRYLERIDMEDNNLVRFSTTFFGILRRLTMLHLDGNPFESSLENNVLKFKYREGNYRHHRSRRLRFFENILPDYQTPIINDEFNETLNKLPIVRPAVVPEPKNSTRNENCDDDTHKLLYKLRQASFFGLAVLIGIIIGIMLNILIRKMKSKFFPK